MQSADNTISNLHYPIRLGQFLKFIDIAQDGHEAKRIIQNGLVRVNGELEDRRGRQLTKGDTVVVFGTLVYRLG